MRSELLRFLLWRMLGVLATLVGFALIGWFVDGGPGRVLRARGGRAAHLSFDALAGSLERAADRAWIVVSATALGPARLIAVASLALTAALLAGRARARRRRVYVRLRVDAYRLDWASSEAVARMFAAFHRRLARRWWRRLLSGQPSIALEVHLESTGVARHAWLAVTCPCGLEAMVQASLQGAYPNCRVRPVDTCIAAPCMVRLKKHASFITRGKALDRFEQQREPPMNRLLTVMGACAEPAVVQLAMTPTPALFEAFARHVYRRREVRIARERRAHLITRDRSMVDDAVLRGGLELQHSPLCFVDLRVIASHRTVCERIASELRVEDAENRLVERGTEVRHRLLRLYRSRVQRGEGNPLPSFCKGVFAPTELAAVWQLPSIDYLSVPFARTPLPLAPAPPRVWRPRLGPGSLRDARGAVSIDPEFRKQNTAVPGTVEQGKSSYLVATVAEDVCRERCAVIVLDPKGDAAEAAISQIPAERTCTLLDFAHPTCGFNPLAVDAPADVIADYVVAALKNLFTDDGVILQL